MRARAATILAGFLFASNVSAGTGGLRMPNGDVPPGLRSAPGSTMRLRTYRLPLPTQIPGRPWESSLAACASSARSGRTPIDEQATRAVMIVRLRSSYRAGVASLTPAALQDAVRAESAAVRSALLTCEARESQKTTR